MTETTLPKLDRHLRAMVDDAGKQTDTVPVVIRVREQAAGTSPAEKARDFENRTRPLVERLKTIGAEIVGLLWIADSIAVRMPVSQLSHAAEDEDIHQLISDHTRRAL